MPNEPPCDTPEQRAAYAKILTEWVEGVEVSTADLMATVEANYLNDWMQLATMPRPGKKTTSSKAARELCAVASLCLARNHPMPDAVRLHVAKALKAGAEGRSVDAALKIKPRPALPKDRVSRDPMDTNARENAIAGFMLRMTVFNHLTDAEAKGLACKEFARPGESLDDSTVEKIWRRLKPSDEAVRAYQDFHEATTAFFLRRPPAE